MQRLTAIFLSLLLFWVQAVVLAQPALAEAPAKCTCCSCKTAKCCVGESSPIDSTPQPVAPSPSVSLNQTLFAFPASLAWSLPAGEAEVFSAASVLPPSAARVPLFTRDCALLI